MIAPVLLLGAAGVGLAAAAAAGRRRRRRRAARGVATRKAITVESAPIGFRAQNVPARVTLTVPPGFNGFEGRAAPWVASVPALLGLRPGERAPAWPRIAGAGPLPVSGHWDDLTKGLGNSATNGPVPPKEILDRLRVGAQFMPAKSGKKATLWSTWHAGVLRAASSLLLTWNRGAESEPLRLETAYGARTFDAMADALDVATERGHGKDLILEAAFGYTASSLEWLRDHDREIFESIATFAVTGYVSPVLASGMSSFASGAAAAGPAGVLLLGAATLAVAIYAFVTGARPGDTRGAGDDVLAFPRFGTAESQLLRPVDVDGYVHGLYRAVLLDAQRQAA